MNHHDDVDHEEHAAVAADALAENLAEADAEVRTVYPLRAIFLAPDETIYRVRRHERDIDWANGLDRGPLYPLFDRFSDLGAAGSIPGPLPEGTVRLYAGSEAVSHGRG